MPTYHVDKLVPGGQVSRVSLEADSEQAIQHIAQSEGWTALRIRPVRGGSWLPERSSSFSLNLVSHELKTLLEAGLPLIEVLTALMERETNPSNRAVFSELKRCVETGESLSDAFAKQPKVFPPLFVATIRSGERTGDLPRVIGRFLTYSEQLGELRRKLLSAVTYPLLLITVGSAVVMFLLVYLVPRFSAIYEQVDVELSLPARLLLQWGIWAQANPWLLGGGLVAIPCLVVFLIRSSEVRLALSRRLLESRVIGRHWHTFSVSRYCRSLALLSDGGIPLPEAMQLAGGLLPELLQLRLAKAIEGINRGERLSEALSSSSLLTPIALRLLRAGERSSEVPRMLEQAADFHDRELALLLERLAKLAEPLLMLFIGLLIGSIVVLMYLPIFELAGSLRP
ncbi:type II secretion system F family protein [Pseudomonas sp. zfem003]|uniref:type II secretion system F family protein n=1 Tax=Pseudomonas sp. zfem003 TaxID=3078198 RepID=UPI002929C5D4|nr:type II secretion system F family protein [Pseudomonas sp. zfem003]MDU9398714.1 type II secretion system F family protein [Pseudomonas sp. zfem003]